MSSLRPQSAPRPAPSRVRSRAGWFWLAAVVCAACGSSREAPAPADTAEAARPATSPPTTAAPAPEQPRQPGPLLWKIPSEQGASYVFGTMHLGIDAGALPASVWDALDQAKTIVVESNTGDGKPEELLAIATLEEGTTLDQMLTPAQWKTAQKLLSDIPLQSLRRFQPWFASVQISGRLLPPGRPMEAALVQRAVEQKKPVVYLEDWREQMQAIAKAATIADLKTLLDDQEKARRDLDAMIAAYRAGDEVEIRSLVDRVAVESNNPSSVVILLDERNAAWIDKIVKEILSGGAFIAVGAAHLHGKTGLLTLLEQRGLKGERVRNSSASGYSASGTSAGTGSAPPPQATTAK